jgi:site-specific recombinase
VDLITKMKEIMNSTESAAVTRETVRDIVRQKLPELMRKVVNETQNAHEIFLAEKQLLS